MSTPANTEPLSEPLLCVRGLDVFRGRLHVLRDIALTIAREPVAIVGRNGMGKTTLCEALVGLLPVHSGVIRVAGQDVGGLRPFQIARVGIGYVPQGRRIFASLTVDEHLRLVASGSEARWTLERVYRTFPRLAERRFHRAATLSGGEQQMLAIARALLINPKLLMMDEPTEGLAPAVVEDLARVLRQFCGEGGGLLLVEQNLEFVAEVATKALVMVNGQIVREMIAAQLAASEDVRQSYLGLSALAHDPKSSNARIREADRFG